MAMPTKAASKWSRLQAAKTKVTNATRQTDGAGAGVNEGEWANEKYLPKRILLHFRTGLFLCSFRLATSLSPPLLCICSERKQTLRGRPCAILAVIHCEHARPPPCSPLPPLSSLPRVISSDNLGGAFVLRTGNFWLVGWGLCSLALLTDCACLRATACCRRRRRRRNGHAFGT